MALVVPDPDHSGSEDRFVLLGLGDRLRLVIVVHTYREQAEIIRIISARRATRAESSQYAQRSP